GDITFDGGKELQRSLYAFAVKAMLGDEVEISASLFYPRDQIDLRLDDPEATLVAIAGHLCAARANLVAGNGVIGPDSGGAYDDLAFALPANAGATYCKRKIAASTERLGAAAQVWEAP
ncbi:PD-(D/E)XK nuclease family protein, partial [Mesorhizobium sp. M2A.F.Ca.ET.046.02.1.1]